MTVDYHAVTAEQLVVKGETFDAILNMEVIEHVADPQAFMNACGQLMRPQAIMFLATLNRTMKAFALAIVGAEYLLRWLPRGTHEWDKFITPTELENMADKAGLELFTSTGVSFNPLTDKWRQSGDMSVNYMGVARKAS